MIKFWTEDEVEFHGEFYTVRKGRMHPHSVQKQHIPLIVGGFSEIALKRTARIGEGWLGFGLTPQNTRHMLAGIDKALHAAGRKREDLEIVMMPAADDEESERAFVDLGVDRLVPLIGTQDVASPLERLRHLEKLARLTT